MQTLEICRVVTSQKLPLPVYPTHWRMNCQPNSTLVKIFYSKNHYINQAECERCSLHIPTVTDCCWQIQVFRLKDWLFFKQKVIRLIDEKTSNYFCHENIARQPLKPVNLLQTEKKKIELQEPREMRSEGFSKKVKYLIASQTSWIAMGFNSNTTTRRWVFQCI